MRRGLTMIELLVSLSMLAAVMATTAVWIQIVGRASLRLTGPTRWEAGAWAALQLVEDDLLVHDVATNDREPRCEVKEGDLFVRTRLACVEVPSGMVQHRYDLDVATGSVRVQERQESGAVRTRVLLRGVASWECVLDEETKVLAVNLSSRDGASFQRRYRVP